MATRPAWPAPPVTLNTISAGWRVALAAAQDALAANARCPTPTLASDDLRVRGLRLTHEREEVASLLDADARMEHVRLVRRLGPPSATKRELGLTPAIDACIFDLDGVLTASSELHFAAWAVTFDEFLARRLERGSVHFSHYARFSRRTDYVELIEGKPRLDGVRAFLASRGITLPEGSPGDPPGAETVHGLANRKNAALQRLLEHAGVSAFAGSHRYLAAAGDAGLASIVVSASANTGAILEHGGLADLVDFSVDGTTMRAQGLQPKPAPDTLQLACALLGVLPAHAAAFETTPTGVEAARAAGMGLVVGVRRASDLPADLAADVVVHDLSDLLDPRLTR
jgi:beta-phosphoglucomutase-like phosphatase (HAD superfamily)